MYQSWLQFMSKVAWGVFIAMVLWFLLALAFADWNSAIINYYRHLGM